MFFEEIIVVYSKNHMKQIITLYGQNAEFYNVKVGGTYIYHCASKGEIYYRAPGIIVYASAYQ
jgi:hypothetical protein